MLDMNFDSDNDGALKNQFLFILIIMTFCNQFSIQNWYWAIPWTSEPEERQYFAEQRCCYKVRFIFVTCSTFIWFALYDITHINWPLKINSNPVFATEDQSKDWLNNNRENFIFSRRLSKNIVFGVENLVVQLVFVFRSIFPVVAAK